MEHGKYVERERAKARAERVAFTNDPCIEIVFLINRDSFKTVE